MYPQPAYPNPGPNTGYGYPPSGQFYNNPQQQPAGQYFPPPTQNSAYYVPNQQQPTQQPIFVQPGSSFPPGAPYGQPPPAPMGGGPGLTTGHYILQPLNGMDKIIIKQKKEMLEIFSGWETNNRYEVYDSAGRVIYYAFEDTSMLNMCCFGENRPFCIRVIDYQNQQVMVLNSSIDCCTRDVTVEVPGGNLVARIFQEFAFFSPSFYVNNTAGSLVFKVKSPLTAAIGSLSNVNFDVLSSDQKTVVGQITKQWGGFMREWLTDADTFGVTFPPDMDVVWKAVLMAVAFVVDFEFYEKSNRRH